MKYIIITPAFNEENNIERTIRSVIKQTILPIEWIIVNDGSTDETANVVMKYCIEYPWIRLYSFPNSAVKFGEHVHKNFYRGYDEISCKNWRYIVKLDADLDIDRKDFFEFQLQKMNQNSLLGICSGITYSEVNGKKVFTKGRHYWRTGGAMKVYRRECFEMIGGIKPIFGWDGLDEYQAMYHGWKTRTFYELPVNHLGKKRAVKRDKQILLARHKGTSLYQRGYPFEFVIIKGLAYLKKSISHTLNFYSGYFLSKKKGIPRVVTKDEVRFFRKLQYLRIVDKFTTRELL